MIHRRIAACFIGLLFSGAAGLVHGDVKVPSIFGDHMILQQDAKLPVWGIADAGEKVTVAVGDKTAEATAGSDGKWRVNLAPLAATTTPLAMTITGKNTLTFTDVLVGEVWFCSGQSNMGVTLKYSDVNGTEVPKANDPQMRYFHVGGPPGLDPSDALAVGKWELCTPETAGPNSGVAYYFGHELRSALNRPVALLVSAWGGTSCQAWTPEDAIEKDPALKRYADYYHKIKDVFPQVNAEYPAKMEAWREATVKWNQEVGVTYNPLLKAWTDASAAAKAAGQPAPPKPVPSSPQPQQPPQPWGGTGVPSNLFNGEVAPVIPYAIKGVVWYQGESNAGDGLSYQPLFTALITGWREHWGQGNFPFIFVQLPRFAPGANWPAMREAQFKTLAVPNTAMTTIIDVGDPNNIHPTDKLDVGKRLCLAARHLAYGQELVWTGPMYDSMKVEGNAIRLNFTQTGGGLIIGTAPWVAPNVAPLSNESLLGFAIAGEDKKWIAATAKIDGNTVVVSSDQVSAPVAVRYAWQNSPECNLYNKEGLPAAPFRTDDWHDLGESPPRPPVPTTAPVPAAASTNAAPTPAPGK